MKLVFLGESYYTQEDMEYEDGTYSFGWSDNIEQNIFDKTYPIYGTPTTFNVTASGTLSLEGTVGVVENLNISITPSLDISIDASAEANFGVAGVSIAGSSTLIRMNLV